MVMPRPSIGWLGYVLLGNSPSRLALLLGLVVLVATVFIMESEQTITLTYQRPSKFPPPTMFLATSHKTHLTAFDACGIESGSLEVNETSLTILKMPNRVWTDADYKLQEIMRRMPNPLKKNRKVIEGHKKLNHAMDEYEHPEKLDMEIQKMQRKSEAIQKQIDQLSLFQPSDDYEDSDSDRFELEEELDKQENVFKYSTNKNVRRPVWVYLWTSTIFKDDKWAHFVDTLPDIHLLRMDPTKAMRNTPLQSTWSFKAGLLRQIPWISWITAAVGLLWNSGGMVLPVGVVLTKPMTVTSVGTGVGVLAGAPLEEGGISPMILGTPPKHEILSELMDKMQNQSVEYLQTVPDVSGYQEGPPLHELAPVTPLLTEAVKDGCGTTRIPFLYISDCGEFTLLPSSETVGVNARQTEPKPALKTLLHYTGSAADLSQPLLLQSLFADLKLSRYCPSVAREVRRQAADTDL